MHKLGLDVDDKSALFLVPLAIVAWADGNADPKEIMTISTRHATHACGSDEVCLSETGRKFLYNNFVYRRPDPVTQRRVIDLLAALLDTLPLDNAVALREAITAMCVEVAESSGGFLGIFGKVATAEKEALLDLLRKLKLCQSPRACEMLRDLDLTELA